MRKQLIIICCILLSACSSEQFLLSQSNIFTGQAKLATGKIPTTIDLQNNNDFILQIDGYVFTGRWYLINQTAISLTFNEITDLETFLSMPYIYRGEKTVEILSNNKLSFENVILRRKK